MTLEASVDDQNRICLWEGGGVKHYDMHGFYNMLLCKKKKKKQDERKSTWRSVNMVRRE